MDLGNCQAQKCGSADSGIRILCKPFQNSVDLFDIPGVVIGRFQDKRKTLQYRMKGYSLHSFQPNTTLANLLMPILMRTARIFAVIEQYVQ